MPIEHVKRKLVMLTITENCNLDCVYCYEKDKTKRVMDIEAAKNAIDHEFSNSGEFEEIEFDLFGGEPVLCKDLIMELVEWTSKQHFSKPYLFFIQTNGTLVHGPFQEWLRSNKDRVFVGLSLDGTPDTHNKNRSNSYSQIDLAFFVNNSTRQSVRMTINSDTIGNLSKDIIHLHDLGFADVDSYFAYGIEWNVPEIQHVLQRELQALCEYYLLNPTVRECSIFDLQLPNLLKRDGLIKKWCGTGTEIVSIAIDGKKYPCQTFQPNTTPHPVELGTFDFEAIDDFNDPECADCFLEPACPNCYGMNYLVNGNILKRDKRMCVIMRTRILALCYLRGKQIEAGVKQMSSAEVYQTIKAIQMVYQKLTVT
jgi:uncharacterized protein